MKQDWQGLGTHGFKSWSHHLWPCAWCGCDQDCMHMIPDGPVGSLASPLTSYADYDAACSRCEIYVMITIFSDLAQLRTCMKRDDRIADGGRVLQVDFPRFGLVKGDRFEPCTHFWDHSQLYTLTAVPAGGLRLLFWRRSRETRCRHRNPMVSEDLGVEPQLFLGDVLHALFLGVFQHYGAWAFKALVVSNAFGAPVGVKRREFTLACFTNLLGDWYSAYERAHPLRAITKIQDINLKMTGTNKKPRLAIKGGECKYIMQFFRDLFVDHEIHAKLRTAPLWAEASRQICLHIKVLDEQPWRVPPPVIEDFNGRM